MNQLIAVPAFADNYVWLIHNGRDALVVDPGDAVPVQHTLDELGLRLTDILVTHHHADHVSGIHALRKPDVRVHGTADSRLPELTDTHLDGSRFAWSGVAIQVMATPGHTSTHISYFLPEGLGAGDTAPVLFPGDTLFSGGCGRVFDGTIEQLHDSLRRLSLLPSNTRVCAAHEYTLSNLRFAQTVEPDNTDIVQHISYCTQQRAKGRATLPSTIDMEQRINPFMRCTEPGVQMAAHRHGAASTESLDVFAALRSWKNTF